MAFRLGLLEQDGKEQEERNGKKIEELKKIKEKISRKQEEVKKQEDSLEIMDQKDKEVNDVKVGNECTCVQRGRKKTKMNEFKSL